MASRKEEKARLRAEREAREAEEHKAAERKQRLQWAGGGLLVAAAVAAVAVVLVAGGGDSDGGSDVKPADESAETTRAAKPPTARITDMAQAAKQAKCTVRTGLPIEGESHEDRDFKPSDYKTNPPTSGNHKPTYPQDGIFAVGNEPPLGEQVHTLEHGRIDFQYKPGAPSTLVSQLQGLMNETNSYHQNLWQNTTGMDYLFTATAWGQLLGCNEASPAAFDAMRAFRKRYTDKGPEFIP